MSPLLLLRLEWIIVLGLSLGAVLARRGMYRAHGWLQGILALSNAGLVAARMIPDSGRSLMAANLPNSPGFMRAWARWLSC